MIPLDLIVLDVGANTLPPSGTPGCCKWAGWPSDSVIRPIRGVACYFIAGRGIPCGRTRRCFRGKSL